MSTPHDARIARLFRNGRSQAVRIPKELRFDADEVRLRRKGDSILLEPLRRAAWPKGYWRRLQRMRKTLSLGSFARPADPVPRPIRGEL